MAAHRWIACVFVQIFRSSCGPSRGNTARESDVRLRRVSGGTLESYDDRAIDDADGDDLGIVRDLAIAHRVAPPVSGAESDQVETGSAQRASGAVAIDASSNPRNHPAAIQLGDALATRLRHEGRQGRHVLTLKDILGEPQRASAETPK